MKEAIDDFTRIIQIDKSNTAAYNNRAYTYYEMGQYPEALKDYGRAIEITPSNADLYYGRSEVFLKLNKFKEASCDAKKAIELEPHNSKYNEWFNKLAEAKGGGAIRDSQ